MQRAIILMSDSCKHDDAQCSHAVTHSLQASMQLSYFSCGITVLLSDVLSFVVVVLVLAVTGDGKFISVLRE
jgi:hypothetical protein